MNSIRIPEKGITIEYPSELVELNPAQYSYLLHLAYQLELDKLSLNDFKVEWLYYLMNLLPSKDDSAKNENVALLLQTLEGFFIHLDDNKVTLNFNTILNLLPEYTFQQVTYKGPQPLGFDLTYGQFTVAYFVYKDYLQTKNEDALRYLFAQLYTDGQSIEIRSEVLSEMPLHIAAHAFHFFSSIVQHLTTQPITVYGESFPLYEIFDNKSDDDNESVAQEEAYPLSLESVLFDLAENGVFGNASELKQMNVYEVLRYLYRKMKDAEKQKLKDALTTTT